MQVGVLAGDVQWIEMNATAGQRGMQSTVALELNAGDGERQFAELRITPKFPRVRERAVNRNRSGQRRLAIEFCRVRHAQQCAKVEPREFELGVRRIVVTECSLPMQGKSGLLQLRGGGVFQERTRGMRGGLEDSEWLSAEGESGEGGMTLQMRIAQRAGTSDSKCKLAGGIDIAAVDEIEAGDVDVLGARIDLEMAGLKMPGVEVISS